MNLSRALLCMTALALASTSPIHAGVPVPGTPGPSFSSPATDVAGGDWLARVERGLGEREYEATRNAVGLQAPNRIHGFRTYFEPTGVRVTDRTAPEGPEVVRLGVTRWGRPDRMAAVEPGQVSIAGKRVEIRRANLIEWYENSAAGLEQGFTLPEAPEGNGTLVLELSVGGALIEPQERGFSLTAPGGRRLEYGGLAAYDATGTPLRARMEMGAAGVVRITVMDAGARYPVIVDPLLTASGILESNQTDSNMGAVAGAGDVNGDGYADVIVGASEYDAGQYHEGAAFIFLGSAAGMANGNPATAATMIQSNQSQAALGSRVAGAGDVNGDGYDDVIVTAPSYASGQSYEGAAFIFLGSPSGVANGDPATAATTLQSDQVEAFLGSSVAGAGDVNGDGYDDVIVGAYYYDSGQSDEGAAFVFLGSPSGVASGTPATAAAVLQSDQAYALLGFCVAGAGDVNGDGYADVIVGAPMYAAGQGKEGVAFIFLGSASGVVGRNPATAATILQSDQVGGDMGTGVDGAGDVNGDGYSDVIVGAYAYDSGEEDEGAAFIFNGSASGVPDGSPATAATILQSDQTQAYLGTLVAGAGDLNGDGYADVMVATPFYQAAPGSQGAVFAFLGSASGVANGNPATAAAALLSEPPYVGVGFSLAGAGDVNGDGYADIIVGSYGYAAGQPREGGAFVFLGNPSGVPSGSPAMAAAALQSDQTQAGLGTCVAGAGDVNGDGYADVIVGAPNYDAGQLDEGAAFLFLGNASGVAGADPTTAAAVLQSNQAEAHLGRCVAGAGDVNGDGYADVIVGAPDFDAGQIGEGAAFVFSGSATGVASGDPATAAAVLQSDQTGAYLGGSVAGAGDVNGDGYADVIVGARLYNAWEWDEGAAFVFLGSASGVASGSPATAATILQANQLGAYLGSSVAGAGDVNGDGYADVIVGADAFDNAEADEGAAFVFLGSASGVANGDPVTAPTTLQSNQASARLGVSVAGAGDVNGDGYADVIVGASGYDAGQDDEGAAFVFLGSTSGVASGDPATAPTILQANQAGASLGGCVAGAGDVNGDGYADVIVGASGYDAAQTDEGEAFVFHGSASGVASGNPVTAQTALRSDQAGASWGCSVAGAGDINGDGFADVIIGAAGYDAPQTNEGAAFVLLGGGGKSGRAILARQSRADGTGIPVQAWGGSHSLDGFRVGMQGTSCRGRDRVKLELEYCPAGADFGGPQCGRLISASWRDVTATAGGVTFDEPILGLASNTLYHWRARVLRAPYGVTRPGVTAPPNPKHGPWRRLQGQAVEADARTGPTGSTVELPWAAGGLTIDGISPNPATGSLAVSFTLPSAGPAKLELFDIAGRRVWARDLAAMRGEPQRLVLAEDGALSAGIYLVRLSQAGRAVSARVVMLQ